MTIECSTDDSLSPVTLARDFGQDISSSASSTSPPFLSTPSTTSTPSLAHSSSTPSISPTSIQPSTPPSSTGTGLSTAAKAGTGAGVAAGVLLLIGLGFSIAKSECWKDRAKKAEVDNRVTSVNPQTTRLGISSAAENHGQYRWERAEMP